MASQPGNSDDLIAELARLMSKDAGANSKRDGDVAAPKGADARVDPPAAGNGSQPQAKLNGAHKASPSPAGGAPRIRIPGPAPVSVQPPGKPLDFGAAPRIEPVGVPPMPASTAGDAGPSADAQPREPSVEPAADAASAEPGTGPSVMRLPGDTDGSAADEPVRPAAVTAQGGAQQGGSDQAQAPQPSGGTGIVPIQDFHFDFGLESRPASPEAPAQPSDSSDDQRPAAIAEGVPPARHPEVTESHLPEVPEEQHARSVETVVDDEHDAIADLIAAELEAAKREEARQQAQPQANAEHARGAAATGQDRVARRPLPPGIGQRPGSDNDRFGTAPVFGLTSRPAGSPPPATPKPELDPMDEIEGLIGAAMRGEAEGARRPQPPRAAEPPRATPAPSHATTTQLVPSPPVPPPAAAPDAVPSHRPAQPAAAASGQGAPVVPPLTTQFAPRRSALREVEPAPISADEAIRAAAGASGATLDEIELPDDHAMHEAPSRRRRRRRSGGAVLGLAAALVLLIAAGFGLYWVMGMAGQKGPAPVLEADAGPTKEPPPPAQETSSDKTRSAVMAQIDGANGGAKASEQIVSRDQSTSTDIASIASDNTEGGLANRKVRTVTVRPDGTIVTTDDSLAGNQALPVDRPNVPPVAGDNATASNGGQPAASSAGADAVPNTPIVVASDQVPGLTDHPSMSDASADNGLTTGTTSASAGQGQALPSGAPVPLPRLQNRPTAPIGPTDVASADASQPSSPVNAVTSNSAGSPASAAAAPAMPAPQAGAYIQVSSRRSMQDATASMNVIVNKFGNLFNGATPEIQKVDLGDKGTYYRVRIPVASMEDASRICTAMKANGGDCFPTKG